MVKVTFLGAGSAFAPKLSLDIFLIPGLSEGELYLVDIDEERLKLSYKTTQVIREKYGKDWRVFATTDRRKALPKSDFVINCIEVSGLETVRFDYEIPLKYGVDQCIGDTIGPGGIMKALRTVPPWVEILKDIEELAPEAIVLNYTNPMSIMTLTAFRVSSLKVVGLCHSVQGTSRKLAEYLNVPYEELRWQCAGINHMAWFTELRFKGEDMYPLLKKKVREDKELYEKDPVRFEVMLYFGYFVSESSGHLSEYLPYFRKRKELIERYCREGYKGESGFYARNWPKWRKECDLWRERVIKGEEEVKPERSYEYASQIIEGVMLDRPQVIYGNVLNKGFIANLPQDQVVEVACLVDGKGVTPTYFGELPPQCAALCRSNMAVYELTVEGILEKSYEKILQALLLDPLTSAVCSLEEAKRMLDELLEAEKEFVPSLK
ncbi:alpha-galactosidase [Candidatus Calescamantes bacterium]|nr:alpha-galactosidase [Candidatus Calescamantes bacterium]